MAVSLAMYCLWGWLIAAVAVALALSGALVIVTGIVRKSPFYPLVAVLVLGFVPLVIAIAGLVRFADVSRLLAGVAVATIGLGIPGIVLGSIARVQIARTGQRGRGFAIAGIYGGAAVILIQVAIVSLVLWALSQVDI